jgi:hypothetical protein
MPLQVVTTFHNFPPDAQAAFLAAVNAWSAQLDSPVPIRIEAYYGTDLAGGLIGLCIPNAFQNGPNMQPNTWYVSALADKLAGADQQPGQPDIEVHFEARGNWHFAYGTPLPPSKIDFMTVALHELGHGLGFVTLFANSPMDPTGSYGDDHLIQTMLNYAVPSTAPKSFVLPPFAQRACICGVQLKNGTGQVLTDTTLFPNPSPALLGQLTGGSVFFEGPNNRHYQFYAPNPFQFGSSMTHFDPNVLPNTLMVPSVGNGQLHVPDAQTLNVLTDLGW